MTTQNYTKEETATRYAQAMRREPLTLEQVQRDFEVARGSKADKLAMLRLIVKYGNVTPEARQWVAEKIRKEETSQ